MPHRHESTYVIFALLGVWAVVGLVLILRVATVIKRSRADNLGYSAALEQIRAAQPKTGTATWRHAPTGQVRLLGSDAFGLPAHHLEVEVSADAALDEAVASAAEPALDNPVELPAQRRPRRQVELLDVDA